MRRRLSTVTAALVPALTAFAALTAGIALSTPAAAQGWIEPLPGRPDPGVVKLRTNVTVRVTDRVAQVEVEEWFENRGGFGPGEGDYLYPLPGEAVFGGFSLFQGDAELRGETMDAERARSIYEEIVRKRKDPALIELVGHGLLRARVFPIEPGETRRITMRYALLLNRSGDALQFRYAAGRRYTDRRAVAAVGVQAPAPEPRLPVDPDERGGDGQPGDEASDVAPISFTLIVEEGDRFRDAFSPTHEVSVSRDDGRMTIRPEGTLTGDLSVFLPFAGERVGITVASHRPSSENGYFMLTLSPGEVEESTLPRDVTVVVDVSGSMSGEKIEQAKGAVRQLLGTLSPEDRFRLIRFSSGVESYHSDWTSATSESVRAARQWVGVLSANGGTNIAGALDETFRASSPESRLPVVVFMTDGEPTVGETNPERIALRAEATAGRARVFAFGVGYDVNTVLLDRLGAATRGTSQYVDPGEDVERAVGLLAGKIRRPVLGDLAIDGAPVRVLEVYPQRLPDLFAGEELLIFGRYEGAGDGEVAISGRRSGRAERYAARARFTDHGTENDFIPRLWASRKLGSLAQQVRLNGADPELIDEIRSTALRYGLLSDYTSYLVQEPRLAAASPDVLFMRVAPRVDSLPASGALAVRRAERQRDDANVRTLAGVAEAQRAAYTSIAEDRRVAAPGAVPAERAIAGRLFREERGAWVDALHHPEARVIEIEPFSDAYFALLRRLPELEPYWAEMPNVLVAGRELSIRVAAEGASRLSDAELTRIVRAFRFETN